MLFLLNCFNPGHRADKSFKQAYDEYKNVYYELLQNQPFSATKAEPIIEQLPLNQLQTGDVILRLMDGMRSILSSISIMGGYSHVGIILQENDSLFVADCQPHNAARMGGHSLKKHRLSEWVADVVVRGDTSQVLSVLVMRCAEPFSLTALQQETEKLIKGNVVFDSGFCADDDSSDIKSLYCSEFIYVVFKSVLGRDNFIFFSDPIANKVIDQILAIEKENKYPDFFRMLRIIESRFKFNIHYVKNLISPAVFEYSAAFQPVCFARHPQLHNSGYLPFLKMYAYLQHSVIVLRALNGLPTDIDLEAAFAYADLDIVQKKMLRQAIDVNENNSATFSSDVLIPRLLSDYAGAATTFDILAKAIGRLEPPKGHGHEQDNGN